MPPTHNAHPTTGPSRPPMYYSVSTFIEAFEQKDWRIRAFRLSERSGQR